MMSLIGPRNRSTLWFLFAAMAILAADTAIARTSPFGETDALFGYAVLFDFALVIPFLFWLLVLRKRGKSIAKALALPIAGAVAAWFVLPEGLRDLVWKTMLPFEAVIVSLELFIIGYEVRVLYRFVRKYRQIRKTEPIAPEALRMTVKEGFGKGKLAHVLLHDINLFYYLLFSWGRKRAESVERGSLYTYHKKTSQMLYAGIITHILVFEAVVVHLLVAQLSHVAAWIATAADLWLLALIWADCRAAALRPVTVEDGMLRVRYGLRIQADVPLDAIGEVEARREFEPTPEEKRKFAGPILGAPNVRIALNRPLPAEGLLFLPREVTGIYLTMDEPDAFVREIKGRIG